MAKRPPNDGAGWSARELNTLKALAKEGTPSSQVAKQLGRTAAAIQQKAMRSGISFRAAKRSGVPQEVDDFRRLSVAEFCRDARTGSQRMSWNGR